MNDDTTPGNSLTYADAGVNIDAGNELVDRIKQASASTRRPEVIGNLGGFGALCKLPTQYKNPVLVSGTDGVGTKLKLAIDSQRHATVGIDLVAMCVNDLLVIGAEPLFFLDYYASAALQVDVAESVINGIAQGCKLAGAALIGGETAEMPSMYQPGDYDLAGFCVGVVEQDEIIDGSAIAENDTIIGLASSGAHSNGYSLIRKIIDVSQTNIHATFEDQLLVDYLLEPTRIYVKPVLKLIKALPVNGLAHITGGGISENLPRVLPSGIHAEINLNAITLSPLFNWLQQTGGVSEKEMLRTFNCGIGMIVIVPNNEAKSVLTFLADEGETAIEIGKTIRAKDGQAPVTYHGKLFN